MTLLNTIGVGMGAAAGIVVALKIFTSFAPFQFVWKRLINEPVQEGLRSVVRAEITPMLTALRDGTLSNHGSSLRDVVDRLEKGQIEMLEGIADAKQTAVQVRKDLETAILAGQGRL